MCTGAAGHAAGSHRALAERAVVLNLQHCLMLLPHHQFVHDLQLVEQAYTGLSSDHVPSKLSATLRWTQHTLFNMVHRHSHRFLPLAEQSICCTSARQQQLALPI